MAQTTCDVGRPADIHEYTGPQDYKILQDGQSQKPEPPSCIHTLDFTDTLEAT